MINDIEKLDVLPFKESRKEYITRRYGDMWNLKRFDSPWHLNDRSQYPWVKAERIIKKFVGKNYDKAFSVYCKLVKQYEYHVFYDSFFNKDHSYYEPEYIIDKQKRIQINKKHIQQEIERRNNRNTGGVWFKSLNYELGYINRITGEIIDNSEYNRRCKYNWKMCCYDEDNRYLRVVISGFEKHFNSKKDPEYIRLMAEKKKQIVLYDKRQKKHKRNKVYSFLSREEENRKYLGKLDKQKIEAHGFDENSFKGEGYHGQQRKKKITFRI